MSGLDARLRRLEAVLKVKMTGLIMPDGETIMVSENTTMECLCEVIDARREGRRPSHPYLDAVLTAKGETGDSTIWQLVQVLYRDHEKYGCFAERSETGGEVKVPC
jgi:hypothetical protein